VIYDAKTSYSPVCTLCVSFALEDTTAFDILLSGAAHLLAAFGDNQYNAIGKADAVARYSKCLRDVQKRLNDAQELNNEGLLQAVSTLACHAVRVPESVLSNRK
jgi:hypothetical protein